MTGRLPPERWWPAGDPSCSARVVALATGMRVRVVEAGPPDGTPVLLLHGFGVHAWLWSRTVAPLAAAGYRVVAPDLPGHGQSTLSLDPAQYTAAAMVAHVAALADALSLGAAHVVGQSMGGMLAVRVAQAHPARVRSLALFAPVGFGPLPALAPLARLVPDVPGRLVAAMAAPWMVRAVLARVWGEPRDWTARDEAEYWAPTARPEQGRVLLRLLQRFDWGEHDAATLRALSHRTLVVFGTRDRTVRPVRAAALVAQLPAGQLVMVPQAGHALPAERPGWSHAALAAWFAGAPIPPPPSAG